MTVQDARPLDGKFHQKWYKLKVPCEMGHLVLTGFQYLKTIFAQQLTNAAFSEILVLR